MSAGNVLRWLRHWLWDEGWFFAGCMGLAMFLGFVLVAVR